MGLFDHFPYTNFHELNLDWILMMLQKIDKTMDEFVAINALKYADPIQWNITNQYEKNTIVIDPLTGSAYISVQPVPTGVSLANTDYWTIVFDLGMFVVRAAKNLATVYEADTTTTATVSIAANTWLIWGDTLYKALVNITAGDTYVDGSNIQHFTIEDVIGHLEDLNTTDKSNLVAAINEVLQTLTDTCGDLDNLTTTDKSNLVAAINENRALIENFVTPEQFGAAGDGVADDTQALLDAIDTGKAVYLENSYLITSKITLTSETVILFGSDVSQLIYAEADDMFLLDSCVITIDNVRFNCTGSGIIFNSVSTVYKLTNVDFTGSMAIIDQRTDALTDEHLVEFINCTIDATDNGIIYHGNSYCTCHIENCHISTNDLPYFIATCKYAEVFGGEYSTKTGTGACNLYSIDYATIDGGFYHDMQRGATIGGPTGKCGTITGTKNTDVTFSGISVDYATSDLDPFSEGKAIVIGNIIESDNYGIYVQGRKMIISNNEVYCRNTASGTKYGIRLNCNEGSIVDYGSQITNNLIDCNNSQYTYPIYLAGNTIATIKNNTFTNAPLTPSGLWPSHNVYDPVYEANDASFVPYDNVVISDDWGVYVVDDITANKNIYLPTWGANSRLTDVGRKFFVVNKSATYTVTINVKGSNTHIYSTAANNYVPPESCALVISIGSGEWVMMPMSLNAIV